MRNVLRLSKIRIYIVLIWLLAFARKMTAAPAHLYNSSIAVNHSLDRIDSKPISESAFIPNWLFYLLAVRRNGSIESVDGGERYNGCSNYLRDEFVLCRPI